MITLRKVREDDLQKIMDWRMDPDITRYMNTNPVLTLEGQKKWLDSINSNNNVKHWVIEKNRKPIGMINLVDIDWEAKNASWGYYVGEVKERSLHIAISLEMSLYDYVFENLGFDELHNEVFSLNKGVIKLHEACGSHVVKEVKGEVEKEGVKYDITHISITRDEWLKIKSGKSYEKINFDFNITPHHIGYAVADIEKSLLKYKQIGYYQSSPVYDDLDRSVQITFIRSFDERFTIELIAPMSDDSPVSGILKQMKNVSSPYHICYEVDDMDEAIINLKNKNFILTKNPAKAIAFDDRKVVFMVNREVGLIELVELQ